jgi:hypothetical protein
MVLVDAETGREAEPVLVDRATGRRVDGDDFVFTAGPAASKPFRDRYATRPHAHAGCSDDHWAEQPLPEVALLDDGAKAIAASSSPRLVGKQTDHL